MEEHSPVAIEPPLPQTTSQQVRPIFFAVRRLHHLVRSLDRALTRDWHGPRYTFFAALLMLLTTLVVVAYYLNHPRAELLSDTTSYLYVVRLIETHEQLVNFWRLPGYPLLIVLVYSLAGQGNMAAVSLAQAVLFVLATLEFYILTALVLRRAWVAFLIGLLIGANLPLLSHFKPIMSESLALWLSISLTLAIVSFLYTLRVHILWLVTVYTLLLFLTRPEWIYLPIPLFAYLLLVAAGRGMIRRLLPHALLSVVLLHIVLGSYVYINATQNRFPGLTWIENINALGKVLQYNMQDEAPPQYASIRRILDTYVARGNRDPYPILAHQPTLSRNYAAPAGKFAQTIIERHLGEFLVKSVPVLFYSLTDFHNESRIVPTGPFGLPLTWLQSVFRALYAWNILFPLCALLWLLLLCWRRIRRLRMVQTMGAVIFLSLYGLVVTDLGGYRGYDYMRVHTIFDPLLILVIWGSLLAGPLLIVQQSPGVLVWLARHSFLQQEISISMANILIIGLSGVGLCFFAIHLLMVPDVFSQVGVVFFFVMGVASVFCYFRPGRVK